MIADKFVAKDEPPFDILKIEALGRTNLFRFGIPDIFGSLISITHSECVYGLFLNIHAGIFL